MITRIRQLLALGLLSTVGYVAAAEEPKNDYGTVIGIGT